MNSAFHSARAPRPGAPPVFGRPIPIANASPGPSPAGPPVPVGGKAECPVCPSFSGRNLPGRRR